MKRILMMVVMALTIILAGCDSAADKTLKAEVEHANKSLPANGGDGFVLERITLDDNALNINFVLVGPVENLDAINNSPKAAQNMKKSIAADTNLSKIAEVVKESGRDIRVNYTHRATGRTASFSIPNEEL